MGIIYKEVVSHKKLTFLRGLFFLFLFSVIVNLMVNGEHYSSKYNIRDEGILFINILFCAFIVKTIFNIVYKKRIRYNYMLIDKELIFHKVIGERKKAILSVNVKDIEFLVPLSHARECGNISRTYKFLCCASKQRIFYCVANSKGEKIKFYFEPSDELLRKLEIVMNE